MNLTKSEWKKARTEFRQWIVLVGDTRTKADRKRKWKEILRDAIRDKEQAQYERERRQSVLASTNRKEYLAKFKKYQKGTTATCN